MISKIMRSRIMHKELHLWGGAPKTVCGRIGNFATHSDWLKVTCRSCLKSKRAAQKTNQS